MWCVWSSLPGDSLVKPWSLYVFSYPAGCAQRPTKLELWFILYSRCMRKEFLFVCHISQVYGLCRWLIRGDVNRNHMSWQHCCSNWCTSQNTVHYKLVILKNCSIFKHFNYIISVLNPGFAVSKYLLVISYLSLHWKFPFHFHFRNLSEQQSHPPSTTQLLVSLMNMLAF